MTGNRLLSMRSLLRRRKGYIFQPQPPCQRRLYASKNYSNTLNLPKTSFELWGAGKREVDLQKVCGFESLYDWQRNQDRPGPGPDKQFCLHDGPPYANGPPHIGHALNKVLKDVVNRYKLMRGYKVHYVPGWDCHGLPIEMKALSENSDDFKTLPALQIRQKARKFAEKSIKTQMDAFKRWGVMADWSNCYYTFDKKFEANQLRLFYQLIDKGYVYRDLKPVNWSTSSRTALAEAELEYNPEHVSPSLYAKFQVSKLGDKLQAAYNLPESGGNLFCLIWTNTPWTLPSNEAVCYLPQKSYCIVEVEGAGSHIDGDHLMLSADGIEAVAKILGAKLTVISTFQGSDLEGAEYKHPIVAGKRCSLLPGSHVKMNVGTGLVHTSPSHGTEDYGIALEHDLPLRNLVDKDGLYTEEAGPELAGRNVLKEANQIVLSMLRSSGGLVQVGDYRHSYPYDWRTKQPVITRASQQWFIDTDAIRDKALECLQDVKSYPEHASKSVAKSLTGRSFWCISRQRVWGVPIPVFYHKETDQTLLTKESVEHVAGVVEEHGSDAWWSLPLDQLLPEAMAKEGGGKVDPSEFERGQDIMDIWFDIGTTWSHTLRDTRERGVADLYLEGEDQYGAWFQTSLLTSAAVQERAPYRSLYGHGFILDDKGQKMSKSLGNVIDPNDIINGGKDSKKEPAYGADVMRWKMIESSPHQPVEISARCFIAASQHVSKIRNTVRYCLGNLHDFSPDKHLVLPQQLHLIDQYMLHILFTYHNKVTTAYEELDFSRVGSLTLDLIYGQISTFYFDTVKDRLYCEGPGERSRRSCQTVLYHILEMLTTATAPILPHLAEESALHKNQLQKSGFSSVFKSGWITADSSWHRPDLELEWQKFLVPLRETFHRGLDTPDHSRQFDVLIHTQDTQLLNTLQKMQGEERSCESELAEFLMCSYVTIKHNSDTVTKMESPGRDGSPYWLVAEPAANQMCQRCRKHTAGTCGDHSQSPSSSNLCTRCTTVLTDGWQ